MPQSAKAGCCLCILTAVSKIIKSFLVIVTKGYRMQATLSGHRIIHLAKILADIAWWLSIAASVIGLVLILLWPLATLEGFNTTTQVQVSISDEGVRRLLSVPKTASGGELEVENLEEFKGRLEFRPLKWWLVLLGGLVAVPGVAAGLLGLYLLRSFLRDVRAAQVFTATNARCLSWLGWLMIAAGMTLPLVDFGYSLFLVRRAGMQGLPLQVGIDTFHFLPGLLVLVVAAAWRYGVELRQDQELTI